MASESRWIGHPLQRLEDDVLLRGAGRFLDDLDPVAHAGHAAVLRSQLAHARITRLDPSAALAQTTAVTSLARTSPPAKSAITMSTPCIPARDSSARQPAS